MTSFDFSQDRIPGAIWAPISGKAGMAYTTTANPKLCLHTTETTGLPNYDNPPHLTVDLAGTSSRGYGTVWQHVGLDYGAYALRSPGRPESPNADAGPVLQVELIAYAADTAYWPAEAYDLVAELCIAAIRDRAIAYAFAPGGWPGSDGYGEDAPQRFESFAAYKAFSGIHGHQHVPANTHWDIGRLNQARLEEAIEAKGEAMLSPQAAEFYEAMYADFMSLDPPGRPTSMGNLFEEYRARAAHTGADGAKPAEVADRTLHHDSQAHTEGQEALTELELEGHAGALE